MMENVEKWRVDQCEVSALQGLLNAINTKGWKIFDLSPTEKIRHPQSGYVGGDFITVVSYMPENSEWKSTYGISSKGHANE
jgi:P2-related tail formation protein